MPCSHQHTGNRRGPVRLARLVCLIAGLMLAEFALGAGRFAGLALGEALEVLRREGAPLVYSTNLVRPELLVQAEPDAAEPVEIAGEILQPHGLALRAEGGMYLVVRVEPPARTGAVEAPEQPAESPLPNDPAELETITVSASRYVLQGASQFFVDQSAIQALPDLGEDPMRAAHRLPGTAASGLSSKSHFRGGEHDETAIYLNGLELLEPFHIRDYHSVFSSIDARAISGVEAYTGGFPARYGDHMSGVLTLESQFPESARHTELGLSMYNTSFLHSGYSADQDWDWLFSARDSNLDIVLRPSLGEPDYFDVFAQLGHRLSATSFLSINALYADDGVTVITESDPDELERSDSDTKNQHLWLRLDNEWLPDLSSVTVLSARSIENLRVAEMNDPDKMVARVRDDRELEDWGLGQHWQWTRWARHNLRWGFQYHDHRARYEYTGLAVYNGFLAELEGLQNPTERIIRAAPKGHETSFYLSDRWSWTDATFLELGLRWDRQTWTEPSYGSQLSPRVSFLHRLDADTDIRFSWGRYSQSQAIHRLQVEDGLDQFFAPQRSDHFIAGYRKFLPGGYRFRAELFLKRYVRLKPRFENLFDPLALIPELAPDRVRLDPSSAEARGLELSVEFRDNGPLEWWASYVLSRATDRIEGLDQPRSWDQRHAFQAGLSWRSDPWEFGFAVNAHTGWPTTPLTPEYDPEEDELVPVLGERNSENYKTFVTLDLRVSREFSVRRGRLSAFFEVSNATNRDNPCCVDYDLDDEVEPAMIDRSEDFWVPIIPAVGILWEF